MNNLKKTILIFLIAIIAVALVWYFWQKKGGESISLFEQKTIVKETIKMPETKSVAGTEGWFVDKDNYKVPLVPKREGDIVVVEGAVLTPKSAYDKAIPEAQKWSQDAKLVFIKSLGTVMLDGKSIGWQVVFGSKFKKAGYEIILERGSIVSQKEIESNVYGADVPQNFAERDAEWAIKRLAENPQFQTSNMTGLNLVYNPDAKAWDYIIANSFGGTSVRVR